MTTIRFNKPFRVLSQFSSVGDKETLTPFIDLAGVYPAGRLDYDSEGLILLTDNGPLQHRIADPRHKLPKTYWAQLEGEISAEAITALQRGVKLNEGKSGPAKCTKIDQPRALWPRTPPIRERKKIPTSWIELTISEGKNRQVRRMTAAVGFPTLRLIRFAIGAVTIEGLAQGEWHEVDEKELLP